MGPEWEISPDDSRVVYFADHDTSGVDELYSVPTGGGAPVKLNPPLPAGGYAYSFKVSADSARVVHLVDPGACCHPRIYSTPIGGGEPLLLASGQFPSYRISPDGSTVVYRVSDYSVPIDGGSFIQLSPQLNPPVIDIPEFLITPDGTMVIYTMVTIATPVQLHAVPIDGGPSVLLGLPPADGEPSSQAAAQGPAVVFRAKLSSSHSELFASLIYDTDGSDGDGDGRGGACDCDDLNGSAWAEPGPASSLTLARVDSDTELQWEPSIGAERE